MSSRAFDAAADRGINAGLPVAHQRYDKIPHETDWPGDGRAVRDRGPGQRTWRGAAEGDGLNTLLGWLSIGLGAAEILAPRQVSRAIGLRPGPATTAVLQTMGVREVATGLGILMNPTAKEWVGARVAGDMLDLALLGVALPTAERPGRTALAAAVVLGVGSLDLLETERLSTRRKAPAAAEAALPEPIVYRSITIGRPVAEVYAYWRDYRNAPRFMERVDAVEILDERRSRWHATGPAKIEVVWESETTEAQENERIAWHSAAGSDLAHEGQVEFRPGADADETVVTVTVHYAPPGGRIAAALLRLIGQEPGQQLGRDLRRLKQILETGEVVLSEAAAVHGPAAGQAHPDA